MAGKIRLHELAKELGLTNKETLDLSVALGIGVKSHSSSIEEAQADRVRRRVEREGLKRDVQPEEPKPEPKGGSAASAPAAPAPAPVATNPVPASTAPLAPVATPASTSPASGPATPSSTPAAPLAPAASGAPAPAEPEHRVVRSRPVDADGRAAPIVPGSRPTPPGVVSSTPTAPQPPVRSATPPGMPPRPGGPLPAGMPPQRPAGAPARPAGATPPGMPPRAAAPAAASAPAPAPAAPVAAAPAAPSVAPTPAPAPAPTASADAGAPAPTASADAPARPGAAPMPGGRPAPPAGGPPRSTGGRPIPPPPGGPPRSMSGRPIPPPPGGVGRPAPPGGPRTGGAGRPAGGPGGPPRFGGGGPRPSGGPGGGGGPRPYGGPGGGAPGRPGGGGPGGGGGGRPTGARRAPRRTKRRRRNMEELTPQSLTTYTSTDAPVPEGTVVVERGASAQELGPQLNRTAADVVRFLMQQGEMVTATMTLTDEQIELFALELQADVLLVDPGQQQELELQALFNDDDDDEDDLRPRPPVITVMGHVDHGKTLLLDRIRSANVIAGEAGGITQHIGAYQVDMGGGRQITFIDTPGHEAFTKMRARGADATDIVVLVVAADDGVMPQTIEALNHARAADVPIVVAVNKIDRDNADPQRVLSQLSEHGLVPEQWGGDTIVVEMSALQNLGIDDLLEQLVVVAELEDLAANPEGMGRGIVLEANLDVGRGPVATVLVQSGTLRVGDPIVAGAAFGTVRALINDRGEQVKEAPPSMPVSVLGLSSVPGAGDEFRVAPSQKTAKTVAEAREQRQRTMNQRSVAAVTHGGVKLEDIFAQIQRGEVAALNLILKADVQGSLEALTESLRRLERDEVKLAFVHRGVGGITENDVDLASTTNATIIGFNVRPDRKARTLAASEQVDIRTYEIIYQILEDIEKAMVGMLAPEFEEVVTGEAEVREIFRVPRIGAIAGCYVTNGTISRGSKVRFLRDGTIIWKGSITSLRRFKDDAREVREGFECGIGLSDFQDLKPGDVIETFDEREIPRT